MHRHCDAVQLAPGATIGATIGGHYRTIFAIYFWERILFLLRLSIGGGEEDD